VAIAERRMTLEEFLTLPEEEPALELIDGMVTQKVSPKFRHGRLQYKFAERINLFAEPRRLAMAVPEVRTTFAGCSPVPDVSVYRWERVPRGPKGKISDEAQEPPDIAIEIISPGQRVNPLIRRCLWYLDNGVSIALLVDPEDESIITFRHGAEPKALHGEDQIEVSDVLPGFQLTVQELFDSLYDR
jgi:Uma2 family endonuclease